MALFWREIDSGLLLPEFIYDLKSVLEPDPSDWYVTWGFRSIEDSDKLFAAYATYLAGRGPKAPKAAQGGKSPHNFGLAVDLALDGDPHTPRVQPEWNEQHPDWIRLRSKIDAHPRLHGGWWFGDGDHIERTHWKQFTKWHLTQVSEGLLA